MPTLKSTSLIRRSLAVTCSLFVLLALTGCPRHPQPTAAPGSASANATAPSLHQQQAPNRHKPRPSAGTAVRERHHRRPARTKGAGPHRQVRGQLQIRRRQLQRQPPRRRAPGLRLRRRHHALQRHGPQERPAALRRVRPARSPPSTRWRWSPSSRATASPARSKPRPPTPPTKSPSPQPRARRQGHRRAEDHAVRSSRSSSTTTSPAGSATSPTHPAGHAHLVRSLERAGKYKDMISSDPARKGRSAGPDLPGRRRVRLPAAGAQRALRRRRHVAVHALPRSLRPRAQRLLRRALRPRKIHPRLRPIHEDALRPVRRLVPRHGRVRLGSGQRAARRRRPAMPTSGSSIAATPCPAKPRPTSPASSPPSSWRRIPSSTASPTSSPTPPVLSDNVTTNYAIDLRLVADLTDATVPEIVALNPALLRLTTPRDIPYDLHIPPGTRDIFLERLKDIPEANRASWRFHVVKPGETLDQIADVARTRTPPRSLPSTTSPQPHRGRRRARRPHRRQQPPHSRSALHHAPQRHAGHRRRSLRRHRRTAARLEPSLLQPRRAGPSLYVAEPIRLAPAAHAHASSRRRQPPAHSSSAHAPARQQRRGNSSHGTLRKLTRTPPAATKKIVEIQEDVRK